MKIKILTLQEIEDCLFGAEILGCGGGGEIEWGKNLIREASKNGKTFKLLDPSSIKDEDLICITGFVGGGISDEIKEKLKPLEKNLSDEDRFQKPLIKAVKELSLYLGEDFHAFLPTETGAGNFAAPFYVAAMTDKYIIDGDACGRAKPEIAISTTHIKGLSVTPLSIVSPYGDTLILKETLSDYRAEDICRYNAVISGGVCAVARCPARGFSYRNAFIEGTVTRAINLGRAIRESLGKGLPPVEKFLETVKDSRVIFRGNIKDWEREKREGFMWGNIKIDGNETYKGRNMKIWYKNEFLISYIDEKPAVMCPDLICIIDNLTGNGLSNWVPDLGVYNNRSVSVITVPADELWKTEKGMEIFGPDHFGF